MPKSKMIYLQFEFDSEENWVDEGFKQIAKRKKKCKPEREGVKVNDRSLIKKLEAKKGCKRVELTRVLCFAGFETTLLAVQAIYRSYHKDGTARETKGAKHYFDSGEFSFKPAATEDSPVPIKTKFSFERKGVIIKANNQDGAKAMVSPSMKMGFLRS